MIFIVVGSSHDYEQDNVWLVSAYLDENEANKHCQLAEDASNQIAAFVAPKSRQFAGAQNPYDPKAVYQNGWTIPSYHVEKILIRLEAPEAGRNIIPPTSPPLTESPSPAPEHSDSWWLPRKR